MMIWIGLLWLLAIVGYGECKHNLNKKEKDIQIKQFL